MEENKEIYKVTDEDLKKRPLSYSSLKEFRRSPEHFIKHRTEKKKITDALIEGQAVDTLLLQPEKFDKRFLIYNKPNLRSNAGKAAFEEIKAEAQANNQTMITVEQKERVDNAVEAVKNTPESWFFLRNKINAQRKLRWHNKETGLPLIGFSDFEAENEGVDFVVDIKTTGQSAEPTDFSKSFGRMGYDLQVGAYLQGYYKQFFKFPEFIFIVVETKDPYGVSVLKVSKDDAENFKAEFRGLLKAFRYCMDNNEFHRSYSFYLYGMKNYFNLEIPKYHKLNFANL